MESTKKCQAKLERQRNKETEERTIKEIEQTRSKRSEQEQ